MPRRAELVIPGVVKHLDVVVGVAAVVDSIRARIHVVVALIERVAYADGRGWLRVLGPGSYVMARGEPQLDQPPVTEFEGTQDTGVGKRVNRVQQGVGIEVV